MKVLLSLALAIFIVVCTFLSCDKGDGTNVRPNPQPIPPPNNRAPVANAGADTTLSLASCGDATNTDLDGSASSDPDGGSLSYLWTRVSGPEGFRLINSAAAKARVEGIRAGEYAFELLVGDQWGVLSRDTVRIRVKGAFKEYDLDLTANGSFRLFDNELDYYSCYYGACVYYDRVDIQTTGSFSPLGSFNVFVSEYNDSAATQYAKETFLSIYQGNVSSLSLYGSSSVNFKKLYQQGGGAFSGTFTVRGGSAEMCDGTVFTNLPPLALSGTIDTAARKATLKITGKVYF